jgi:gliding motility-associated protein GldE
MNSALEPPNCWIDLHFSLSEFTLPDLLYTCLLVVLLWTAAFFSAAETAYFSLSPQDFDTLKRDDSKPANRVLSLLSKSDRFLGTVLVGNNLVNIAIVLLSTFLMEALVVSQAPVVEFLIQTVCVTFLLAFFGEVLPKTLAAQYAPKIAIRTGAWLVFATRILYPFTWIFSRLTRRLNKSLSNVRSNVSIDELSQAVDITTGQSDEDTKILKGIIRYVNIDVRKIMHPRVNVSAVEIGMDFGTVRNMVTECGFSRIPVYDKTPDNIRGILYVKDLMPHLYTLDTPFAWQNLIREAYFVPENKKINDLLEEFRRKKIHMAIVVDEYGGTEGIVTLEDILKEIVGEIPDETD